MKVHKQMQKIFVITGVALGFAVVAAPNAKIGVSPEKGERVRSQVSGGVQLWENGPYFAECNVGASAPHEPGYHFWWGDTVGYRHNGRKWVSAKGGRTSIAFSYNKSPAKSTYANDAAWLKDNGWIGEDGNLVAAHDAATAHLGAPWRMMTKAELDKLVDPTVCERTWTTDWEGTGTAGCVVKGKGAYASHRVFFPAVGLGDESSLHASGLYGYYWTSTPNPYFYYAWNLSFCPGEFSAVHTTYRSYGQSVRAVR